MKALLETLTVEDLHRVVPGWVKLDVQVQVDEVMSVRRISYRKTYRLKTTVGCIFTVADGEMVPALEEAQRTICRELYGPVIQEIQRIRDAVWNEDKQEATALLSALETTLRGEDKRQ